MDHKISFLTFGSGVAHRRHSGHQGGPIALPC